MLGSMNRDETGNRCVERLNSVVQDKPDTAPATVNDYLPATEKFLPL